MQKPRRRKIGEHKLKDKTQTTFMTAASWMMQQRVSKWRSFWIARCGAIIPDYVIKVTNHCYRTRMANSAPKCRIIILITARSFCSYNNIFNHCSAPMNSINGKFGIVTVICCFCYIHPSS